MVLKIDTFLFRKKGTSPLQVFFCEVQEFVWLFSQCL